MKTAVIVPNWNGDEFLSECIDSLIKQSKKNTVIVVDNGSVDKSREIMKSYGNKIIGIYQDKNYGFTGGVNPGIEYALRNSYDAIALFNNDAVAENNWLQRLTDGLDDKSAGIVTGTLMHNDRRSIDSTGEQYSIWGLPFPRDRGSIDMDSQARKYTFGATGGASLYRARLFEEVGLFDQDFFAYYEDVDISFRTQLAGWKVLYIPEAVAFHRQGATSGKLPGFTIYQTFKNLPWVYIKNVPRSLLFPIGVRFFIAYSLMLTKAVASGRGLHAIKGVFSSILLMPKKIAQRLAIQHKNQVSTAYIRQIIWADLPPEQEGLRKLRKIMLGK